MNSRISNLENKFKNLNLNSIQESKSISESSPSPKISILKSVSSIPVSMSTDSLKTKIVSDNHEDNFAKNLAKFAIIILILGVLFFLNYIDNQGWIGPVFKYLAGLSFGAILLITAEYIKNKNKIYTNIIRGASFVIFYLTLFIGYIVFKIISLPITLLLIISVLTISIIISFKENDSLSFTLGSLGAYLVPFLIQLNFFELNQENLIGLMLYLTLLNIAVIFISFKKYWIKNSFFAFIMTWLIFISIYSTDINKYISFIFSTIYGLQYLITFLTHDFKNIKSEKNDFKLSKIVVFLSFLNTVTYIMIFYSLINGTFLFNYIGYFVSLIAVFHFSIYMIFKNISKTNVDVLNVNIVTLSQFIISVLLITAAIPLQFDGPIVTMIWFIEGIVFSILSILKDFKNKKIMYILGFFAIVLGILHMIIYGVYEDVLNTGYIFLNQSYIVWFFVFILINIVAYIWYKTVSNSENLEFKNIINKIAFTLIIIGQFIFIGLTYYEIHNFGEYKSNIVNKKINEKINLDLKLQENYYYSLSYENINKERYSDLNNISKQITFMQLLLFIFLTIIYFVIGLIKKNKIIRNMGIFTLTITSILLIGLTWELGPIYRIITFVGFGLALLIISYLYISKNKKKDIDKILIFLLIPIFSFNLFVTKIEAAVVDLKNWKYEASLNLPKIEIQNDNQNLYIIPIDKDIINLSKKNDLSDIRIIDKDKNEIPYIIVRSNQNNQDIKKEKQDVKILENSLTKDGKRILVLDTNKEGLLYNNIYISRDLKSINFRKKVKVYISDSFLTSNSPSWREVEQKNTIYNYTDGNNFIVEDLDINFSGISSRYIKLELIDDLDFEKNIKVNNKINIESAQIEYLKDENKDTGLKVKDYLSGNFVFDNLNVIKDVKFLSNNIIENKSEIIFEGDINIEEFILMIDKSDKNFNRNIILQGSDDEINWSNITNTNIYRIDSPVYKGEKLNIKLPVSTYKKFKIIIQNNNDKPLSIDKNAEIKIQNTAILFKTNENINISDLKIIVGNNVDSSPVYDIKNIINYFEEIIPQTISYQNIILNKEYVVKKNIIPFGERNKIFLNIGLLLFILIIGIFGFFWMKVDKSDKN